MGYDWASDIRRNCQTIAEAVVQATAEFKLGLSHDHALMAELLIVNDRQGEDVTLPEGVKRQLEGSSTERTRVLNHGQQVLLRHILFGMDCDQEWDLLPKAARKLLLRRTCGQHAVSLLNRMTGSSPEQMTCYISKNSLLGGIWDLS